MILSNDDIDQIGKKTMRVVDHNKAIKQLKTFTDIQQRELLKSFLEHIKETV